ncbi:MAG: class I SAM-dependent methyltransferase [Pleurocapsa sp.]
MSDVQRNRVKNLAQKYIDGNNPSGWFEELYATAQGDKDAIPWAKLTINPHLANWIEQNPHQGVGKTALVVGCGLGDDAEAIAKLGYQTVAFDISPTAIAWCKQRFPDSQVNYLVDDLLQPSVLTERKFDFVVESYTLQALPATVRHRAIAQLPQFVAPQGRLLIICRGRELDEPEGELPWHLTIEELAELEVLGLKQVALEDYLDGLNNTVRYFRLEYLAYSTGESA